MPSARRYVAAGLDGGLRWTVTDVPAKLEIIQAGLGWGGLPEHVVAPALAAGTLDALDVREFEVRAIELFIARRRDEPIGPVSQALWTWLAERPEAFA
jgi:DNA-binding transcriptional LysR family regulator